MHDDELIDPARERVWAVDGSGAMNALERLLDWAQYATPRERWRMERDLDGIGVPFTVDEQDRKQRGVVSLELPTGEDVEYLWALIQAGPDLVKVASTASATLGCPGPLVFTTKDEPGKWFCASCGAEIGASKCCLDPIRAALEPLLGREAP